MKGRLLILAALMVIVMAAITSCAPQPIESPEAGVTGPPQEAAPESAGLISADAPVQVLTERPIGDVVGDRDAAWPAVSPDGTTIAWVKWEGSGLGRRAAELCIYVFATAYNACFETPERFSAYPAQLEWSPDSAYVAFSENPLQLGYESDIWVFSLADRAFADLTDDGVEGSWRTLEAGTYALDYLPKWNASDGLLYFWRSLPLAFAEASMELYRISPQGGEPELVRDVTETLKGGIPVWDYEFFYMDGPWAISPDGTKAAMTIQALQDYLASPLTGLWLLDLADPAAQPELLADLEAFQAALPDWQQMAALPRALSWTSDSSGMAVLAQSNDLNLQINLYYFADAASGELMPVADFSSISERESYYAPTDQLPLPPIYYSPWTATLSPAGDKLLMWNDLGGAAGMLAVPMPPGGELPAVVYVTETSTGALRTRSSTSSDGKVILYGLMLTVAEE